MSDPPSPEPPQTHYPDHRASKPTSASRHNPPGSPSHSTAASHTPPSPPQPPRSPVQKYSPQLTRHTGPSAEQSRPLVPPSPRCSSHSGHREQSDIASPHSRDPAPAALPASSRQRTHPLSQSAHWPP